MFRRGVIAGLLFVLFACQLSGIDGPNYMRRLPTSEKVVALTFDDGPNPFYTPFILRILRQEGVRATFFLLGEQVRKYPLLAKKIQFQGHEIGNHSVNHKSYLEMTPQEKLNDILVSQSIFKKVLGFYPRYFRAPFGKLKQGDLALLDDHFLKVVHWTVDTRDWEKIYSSKAIVNRALDDVGEGSIILLHDSNLRTVRALRPLIRSLKRQGYRFVHLSPAVSLSMLE